MPQDSHPLVWCKHFVTEAVDLEADEQFQPSAEICQLWICLAGNGTIGDEGVRAGEVWLLPETGEQPVVRGPGRFLRTWVP